MHRMKVMLALLLLAFCGVPLAGAAGVGTFSIEQTTVGVGVGQFGIATLYMDNTWQPPADSVILHVGWDESVLEYVSTDWKVGNTVAATLNEPGDLTMSFADWANKYPGGRVPIADINFRGVTAGQTTVGIRIDSVRSHVGTSATEFTELTASSLSNPGIFTVGQGGGTVVPTVPVGTTPTIAPTLTVEPNVTGTVMPTLTVEPNVTVTGNVTGTITTLPTTLPTTGLTTAPTGITTGVPFTPSNGQTGGSEDYTGVVTRTATVTATATGTVTGTATVTATPTMTTDTGNVTVTMTPVMTATQTVFTTAPAGTTTARTTVPVNTTATAAGLDVLPLAVAGLAALALIAARRR